MLTNAPTLPVPGDLPRKWISDDFFDLILWYQHDAITGFQLCYDKSGDERALTWYSNGQFTHHRIDGGEDKPTVNRSPVLVPDGVFPKEKILKEFNARSCSLAPEIRDFVLGKLHQYS